MSIQQTEGVRLLAALCKELAQLGLDVGMSDAKPALAVRRCRTELRLWISVDVDDGFFEWRDGRRRHAVSDPSGAAKLIAVDVQHANSSEM
jgi:hypothetical protein